MDWLSPPTDFQFILFERHNPAENVARFYWLGWQPSLIDAGAVVRLYGRKGGHQRLLNLQPFTSLEEAWPLIRATIKTRLRHGYHVVQPERYCGDQFTCPPRNPHHSNQTNSTRQDSFPNFML